MVDKGINVKPEISFRKHEPYEPIAEIYQALVLGTGDYIRKNGFSKAVVGLSGGVDSSLVVSIAVDAIGRENVIGIAMPSRYTSARSKADAKALANNLGISYEEIPIEDSFKAYLNTMAPVFKGTRKDSTEENIQARIRGNILMALSNKFGWLVLTTGNKSEIATGYCTLYGDMAGGYAVIKDVFKTMVYRLAYYRNKVAGKEIIPKSVLAREPTAELRYAQKDSDSLPKYEILDPILEAYVEEDKSLSDIVKSGYDYQIVEKVINLVDRNEYKRRQAAPGIKITRRAFGKDRRLPITNKFREE
jgi:NAD+ synthase (glutamine-hydrolysing)